MKHLIKLYVDTTSKYATITIRTSVLFSPMILGHISSKGAHKAE